MTKVEKFTIAIERECKDGCGSVIPDITEGDIRRALNREFSPVSATVEKITQVTDSKSDKLEDIVPVSKHLFKDDDHVALICKAFIFDTKWYDGTNPYGPRQYVWEGTSVDSNGRHIKVYRFNKGLYDEDAKKLFMPTDAEIQSALDKFKKKGWHAQYDSNVGSYVVFMGTRALGEYQAAYTRNLF